MIAIIKDNLDEIISVCKRHHVKLLYLFGSAVTENFNPDSDIDFLYEFDSAGIDFNNLINAPYDFADNFFDFKFALEKIFNRKIDLIQHHKFRNPYFGEGVEKTKRLIYADQRFKEVIV